MFEQFQVPDHLRPSDPRFGSGPSLVPMEYVTRLAETGPHLLGTSHRKPPVRQLVKEIQDGLREYFQLSPDYEVILGNGGATFLFDMIALGMVEKKITHFTCGEFSEKWYKASKLVPWLEVGQEAVEYGEGITPTDVPDSDVIATTLNETSTGVQVDQFPKVGDDRILAVDATSGGGQCPIDVNETDFYFFSPQKVFASDGGLFVGIMSPKAKERVLRLAEDKNRYVPSIMNWKSCVTNSEKNQTYNTPAISTLFFLNEQIKRMNADGYEKVQAESDRKAQLVYGWAEKKDYLSPFIKEDRYRSRSVATIDVDDKVDTEALIKVLEEQKAVYGIDPYRKLGRNQFRIALFHNVTYENLEKLTELLSTAIENEI